MQTTQISNGQNILDIAVQSCGDVAAVFDLATKNNIGLTDELPISRVIENVNIVNKKIAAIFLNDKIKPATKDNEVNELAILDGIDYWVIEDDFIIS